ncbi:MAG: PAS domain-containing protein [Desulfitobacteriaceae bacterium]
MITPKDNSDNEYIHDVRAILDKIHEGVLLSNELGSITFVNKNFQELVGHTQSDLEGLRFDQLIDFLNSDLSLTEATEYWLNVKNGLAAVLTPMSST